jgi:hypothetical protein
MLTALYRVDKMRSYLIIKINSYFMLFLQQFISAFLFCADFPSASRVVVGLSGGE